MKIDAEISWLIDDEQLGVHAGKTERVAIDMDYVTADKEDIISYVENELSERYGGGPRVSRCESDDGDFLISNLDDLLKDIEDMS